VYQTLLFDGCMHHPLRIFDVASHAPVYLRLPKPEGTCPPVMRKQSELGEAFCYPNARLQVCVATMICERVYICNYGCGIDLSVYFIGCGCFMDVVSASHRFLLLPHMFLSIFDCPNMRVNLSTCSAHAPTTLQLLVARLA